MKKAVLTLLSLFILVGVSYAQKKAPASPRMSAESDNVMISYGQPSKKGRTVFGDLVPYGKTWRAGANEATEVTFKKNVTFGGKKVKAGTYTLFTIPGENEWEIILNPNLKQWGDFGYNKIKKDDVANIKVKPMKTDKTVEALTYKASDTEIMMSWDDTMVEIPIKF